MRFIAGIDGGGTKTRVSCYELSGNEISRKEYGAFNLNGIGLDAFRSLLTEITGDLLCLGDCQALCIGSAGISNQVMADTVAEAMEQAKIANWKLVGDNVIALWGALEGKPGIALIAGTGSICFGRGERGEEVRSGGWGHLLGDEGSGYALGRDALAAFAREWDGYGEKTLITRLLAEEMGLDTQRKVISYAYGGDKSVIAALSSVTTRAAQAGDAVACRILRDNAEKMCMLVAAVADRLALKETKVAMLGGLLEHDTPLKEAFLKEMGERYPHISCVEPKYDACRGAVMLAESMMQQASNG